MTSVEVFDCEQRSPEWFALRLGIPTASQFSALLAKGKRGGESKTRRTYLLQLAGEKITGEPRDDKDSRHTRRGHRPDLTSNPSHRR